MGKNALRLGFAPFGIVLSAGIAAAHPSPSTPKPIVYAKSPVVVAAPVVSGHAHAHAHSHGFGRVHVHAHGPAHHPVAAPVTARPYDCVCARSASGAKVPVYLTASRWHGPAKAYVGGGKRLVDVTGYHQGHWRVGYYPKGEDGIQYGWVRESDLVCKEYGSGAQAVTVPVHVHGPETIEAPLYVK